MSAIPVNVIVLWTGLHADIPSGFTRETSLDSRYPKATAAATNPDTTGGASTHTHTSPAHSHAMGSHTHTYNLDTVANEDSGANKTATDASGPLLSGPSHRHDSNTSGAANGTTSSDATTYGSASNDPPYFEVIFIKSNGSVGLPNLAVCLFASASIPTAHYECNGANSTPDMRNRFIKGATASGDAGGTGGSTTNSHDITHTHTGSHSHDAGDSAANTNTGGSFRSGGGGGSEAAGFSHQHSPTLASVSTTVNTNTDTLVTAETVQPAFKKLIAIQNKSGGYSLPVGMIGLWLGTLATIPAGWQLYSAMIGLYCKIGADTSEIGSTGGANTHTHAAQAHQHTSASHTHTGSSGGSITNFGRTVASDHGFSVAGHTHPLSSISSSNTSWDNANTTADSSSNEPLYRTVAYIQLATISGGADIY